MLQAGWVLRAGSDPIENEVQFLLGEVETTKRQLLFLVPGFGG
jgi:hypothetical protein